MTKAFSLDYWSKTSSFRTQLFLAILSALFFIPFLGQVHLFDWDEINFAESAREMIVTGNYLDVQINYQAFWEKPPLFFWIQVLSMKIFGVNEFAARFPNAIIGIFSILILFRIGKSIYDQKTGFLWAIIYMGSVLPFLYFKSGIIDPLFNLFIFLGVYQFYLASLKLEKLSLKHVFLSGLFIGLATLTKGPVAFLLFGLTFLTFTIITKQIKAFLNLKAILLFLVTFVFFGGLWFILQLLNGNYTVLVDFVEYMIRLAEKEDAGHGGFFGYHFVVLTIGVFPASIFTIHSLLKNDEEKEEAKTFKLWMMILFWVVIIVFSLVRTKIIHYSSLCYFPMTFLALTSIRKIIDQKVIFKKWMKISISIIASLYSLIILGIYIGGKNTNAIIKSGIIKDPIANANLEAKIDWPITIAFIAISFFILCFYWIWIQKDFGKKMIGLFLSTSIFMFLVLYTVIPRIEKITQNAAIEFFKDRIDEDCYVTTFGYKSYAHYFYSEMPKLENKEALNPGWLLHGSTDKKVYVVCKINKKEEFINNFPNFAHLESKNGFCLFVKQ